MAHVQIMWNEFLCYCQSSGAGDLAHLGLGWTEAIVFRSEFMNLHHWNSLDMILFMPLTRASCILLLYLVILYLYYIQYLYMCILLLGRCNRPYHLQRSAFIEFVWTCSHCFTDHSGEHSGTFQVNSELHAWLVELGIIKGKPSRGLYADLLQDFLALKWQMLSMLNPCCLGWEDHEGKRCMGETGETIEDSAK
jgi:hypothetical protein